MLKPDQKIFLDENNSGYTSMYLRLYCSQVRKRTKTIKFLVIPRNVVLSIHTCTRRIRSRFVFLNVSLGSIKKNLGMFVSAHCIQGALPSYTPELTRVLFVCVSFDILSLSHFGTPQAMTSFLKAGNDF